MGGRLERLELGQEMSRCSWFREFILSGRRRLGRCRDGRQVMSVDRHLNSPLHR